MNSRPKRRCKDAANRALKYESESDDDIYEDAAENAAISDNEADLEGVLPDDDILDCENLTAYNSSGEESDSNDSDDHCERVGVASSSHAVTRLSTATPLNSPTPASHVSSSGIGWSTAAPANSGRVAAQNIINFRAGPAIGVNPRTEREAVLMFLDGVLQEAVNYTNLQARRRIHKWNLEHPGRQKTWTKVDRDEMEAFIGLLILIGAFRARYRDVKELWSTRDGLPICRATMTMERFLQIKSFQRFDDPLRRDKQDPLSPIRCVSDAFNQKLRQIYVPSEWLTVDEQLLEFHGRVSFQQYISSKPGKFGIKLIWLCDAVTFYALNFVIYIGKGTVSPGANVTAKSVTLHLMRPYFQTGRHLTGKTIIQ
jgi:hypothetical protein